MRRGKTREQGRHQRPKRRHHGRQEFAVLGWSQVMRAHPTATPSDTGELAHGSCHVRRLKGAVQRHHRAETCVSEGELLQTTFPHPSPGKRCSPMAKSPGGASRAANCAPRKLASSARSSASQPASSRRVPPVTRAASRAVPKNGKHTCST